MNDYRVWVILDISTLPWSYHRSLNMTGRSWKWKSTWTLWFSPIFITKSNCISMPKVGLHVFPFWTAQLFVWTPHFGWTAPRRLNYTSLASCQSEQLMLFWQKSNSNSLVRRRDVTFDYLIYKMYKCTVLIKEFLSEIRTWRTTPAARLWWRLMMHLYHVRQMEMQSQSHVDRLCMQAMGWIACAIVFTKHYIKPRKNCS